MTMWTGIVLIVFISHQGVAGAGRQSGGHRHRRGEAPPVQTSV